MTKKIISWLACMAVFLIFHSCRNDMFPEKEAFQNSSSFQLTSQRISLAESKHKFRLAPELSKAETVFKSLKTNVSGKTVSYGSGISINTDDVIYIENGPNYHTYTFHIKRENAPENAPLENLLLVPLPDGSYREFLITYNFTSFEKDRLREGLPVDTNGKTEIVKLANGTFNSGGQLARTVCNEVSETVWVECSQHVHNQSNVEDWVNCTAKVKPGVYTVVTMKCIEQNDDVITPIDPGTGGGGGGGGTSGGSSGTNPPCTQTTIPTNPQPGFTDENGCPIGAPTQPNLPDPRNNPCQKAKPTIDKANEILHSPEGQNMDTFLKSKKSASNEWNIAIGQTSAGLNTTPPKEGIASSSTADSSQLQGSYIGNGHSHAGNRGNPSGGDMYAIWEKLQAHQEYKYSFVYGDENGNEEVYALIIHDPTLLAAFFSQFPKSENYNPQNHSILVDSPLGKEFYKARNYYYLGTSEDISNENYESRAIAMAYILDKYNSGISIAKIDANGNLKKINANVQQITIPDSGTVKEGIKVSKCP